MKDTGAACAETKRVAGILVFGAPVWEHAGGDHTAADRAAGGSKHILFSLDKNEPST
jgi:hypothetical protein